MARKKGKTSAPTPKARNQAPEGMRNVTAPVARTQVVTMTEPKWRQTARGTSVKHRELLASVIADTGFVLANGMIPGLLSVNPIQPATFPWLHPTAIGFDKFKIRKLKLHYVPICSSAMAGRVGIFWDPNSQNVGPLDRVEMASYKHCLETATWTAGTLTVPCDNVERFVDSNNTADPKFVDFGRVGFAVYSNSNSVDTLGDIYIEYEIELMDPHPHQTLVGGMHGTPTTATPIVPLNYIFAANTNTNVMVFSLLPGTYLVTFFTDCATTVTGIATTVSGAASFSGNVYNISNDDRAASIAVVTFSDTTGKITYTLTGGSFTKYELLATKTSRGFPIFP